MFPLLRPEVIVGVMSKFGLWLGLPLLRFSVYPSRRLSFLFRFTIIFHAPTAAKVMANPQNANNMMLDFLFGTSLSVASVVVKR